ncbi:MAG: phosphatidate cytidylyltransferase [Actinomycetota bacterium]|nr:phosphatidate cytidylyltransferase [Actinomycetota bacterium]
MADKGRSLPQAVATALILLGVVIAGYLLGRTAFFVLAAAVILVAFFELFDAVIQRGQHPNLVFVTGCCFALLLVAYLRRPEWLPVVAVIAIAGAFAISLRPGRGASAVDDVAWTVLGLAWIGGGGAAAISILVLRPEGPKLLILFLLAAAADDIAAFFAGTAMGKHKMAPSISPAKSWEGVVAGAGGAVAAAVLLIPSWTALSAPQALGVGAIVAVLGPMGDLVESLVKRELGVKDSGRLLPGHGGMLDRLDAIIFCAPAVFLYLRFILS